MDSSSKNIRQSSRPSLMAGLTTRWAVARFAHDNELLRRFRPGALCTGTLSFTFHVFSLAKTVRCCQCQKNRIRSLYDNIRIFFTDLNMSSKTIDFSDVDLYPESYWCELRSGNRVFGFRSFVLEHISQQLDVLVGKKTQLMLGDKIKINTKFGHNVAAKNSPEHWIDVQIRGEFQVLEILPRPDNDDILLKVRRV